MTFDFAPLAQFIDITAQYSNAVLVAVLPYVADFAETAKLAPLREFTSSAVERTFIQPRKEDVAGSIIFTNGFIIGFASGRITGFWRPTAYSREHNPDRVPQYYAPLKISDAEAVTVARATLKRLGIPLQAVFADLEPSVTLPERVGANVIPYYSVAWTGPLGDIAARFEINGNKGTVERLEALSHNLDREPFKVGVVPRVRPDHPSTGLRLTGVNPEYGFRLFPIVLRAVTNYATRLAIELPQPLTSNRVDRFRVDDNGGWPHCELTLTNGTRFIYRNTNVCGYFAPDEFWNSDKRKTTLSDFRGAWRMTDRQMMELARDTLAKLDYPKGFIHTETTPALVKPQGQFANLIPRCKVEWMHPNPQAMTQWAYVEIDADKWQFKAVYFDDQLFRRGNPSIDVPIGTE